MNLKHTNFTELLQFLNDLKITSILTQYNEVPDSLLEANPMPVSGAFLDWCIPSTTFINSLTDKTNPIPNPYFVDASHINESGLLVIKSHNCIQDFRLTEYQISKIQSENFGAIRFHGYVASLLSKNEYEHNVAVQKIREEKDQFTDELRHQLKNLELYKKFKATKDGLKELLLVSNLDEVDHPTFEPIKPKTFGEMIRLVSTLQPNFSVLFGNGIEVTSDQLGSGAWTVDAIGHRFKLPIAMGQALQADGSAWIFENNSYLHICTMEQHKANTAYKEQLEKFKAFEKMLNDDANFLADERQALVAIAQHEKLKNLPFSYYVAIKVNVRLLTANSWGDGAKRNTVIHIVPSEELTGRLKRKANEYLCGGSSSYGTPSEKNDAILNNSGQGLHKPEVTCKTCLEKAMRMVK